MEDDDATAWSDGTFCDTRLCRTGVLEDETGTGDDALLLNNDKPCCYKRY